MPLNDQTGCVTSGLVTNLVLLDQKYSDRQLIINYIESAGILVCFLDHVLSQSPQNLQFV